ncbi:Neutral/alkaline nonlysosomal ceramidase [Suillus cothurnatus]|nr:Neutral/alkaline nonlysosomal ceramidase [Suillus cothurnatus]
MGDSSSQQTILSSLQSLYRDPYTPANTALIKTHAHSSVSDYLDNLLPQYPQSYRRCAQLIPGNIKLGNSAYLANLEWERAMYEENQDTTVTVLGFENVDGDAINLLSFFLVHGTSLYENNTLVSGDNKGMAAWMYKSEFPATTPMLQALEANVGDITPNIYCKSPRKPWVTQPCKFERSTCSNQTEDCHRWVSTSFYPFPSLDCLDNILTALPLLLLSFGIAIHCAVHSLSITSFLLLFLTHVICCLLKDDFIHLRYPMGHLQKHAPLLLVSVFFFPPLLLPLEQTSLGYSFAGLPIIQVCQQQQLWFVVSAMPGELTTMAGRRMRDVLKARLIAEGVLDDRAYVVIVDPENTYGHYITTHEEYGVQRYDGASTIFGPATLDAYINKYSELVPYLAMNATWIPSSNAAPPELTSKAISLQTLVVVDNPPIFKHFGDVLIDVESGIYHARDTVAVWFVGANPWNNLRLDGMFLTVDRQLGYHPSPAEELMITKLHFTNTPSSTNPATHQHWIHATRMLV